MAPPSTSDAEDFSAAPTASRKRVKPQMKRSSSQRMSITPKQPTKTDLSALAQMMMMRDEEEENDLSSLFPTVVKVFCTHTFPNYSLPWQMKRSVASTSTGFLIHNKQILTNAHSVEHYTQVRVRKRGDSQKYIAKVLAIGRDCDMALLTVEDPKFWKKAPFVDLYGRVKKLPKLEERVSVVGYPVGGENLSIAAGVVSRIDMQQYAMGVYELLAVQVDAPINPGNSGGPVFDSQKQFVGIAFQGLRDAEVEGVGYIIPVPVVHHFLRDIEKNGHYTGFCDIGISIQPLENPTLKQFLKMGDRTGVLVCKVAPLSPCQGHVKVGDVLLAIDGFSVADDQTVEFPSDWSGATISASNPADSAAVQESGDVLRELGSIPAKMQSSWEDLPDEADDGQDAMEVVEVGEQSGQEEGDDDVPMRGVRTRERIDANFVVTQKFVGDNLKLKVLRKEGGEIKELDLEITLTEPAMLVPVEGKRVKDGHKDLKLPTWYIVGGLVLVPFTEAYVTEEFGGSSDSAPVELLNQWTSGEKKYGGQEIVLLSQVLAHDSNVGYDFVQNIQLAKVNGVEVRNLKHAVQLIEMAIKDGRIAAEDDDKRYVRLDFANSIVIVLDARTVENDTKEVLTQHEVPRVRSSDLDGVETEPLPPVQEEKPKEKK